MSKRILGLDLGTNSIGWAVVDDLGSGKFTLIKRGVHVFPEGVKNEKGKESSKAAERTGYRAARRLKFRRKLRKIRTLKALSEHEPSFCPPLGNEELKAWQSKKIYPENPAFRDWCKTVDPADKNGAYENPYYFRWLAATTALDLNKEEDRFKLGRALYHIAQRRGFKSNRLDSTPENESGVVKKEIAELSKKMNGRTLGQYFWEDYYRNGKPIRKVHTSRDQHYLEEFNTICEKQRIPVELKEQLHKAIFFQRPLKSQKGLVANCPFEPKKKRCPDSHPLFEEFRMWQVLNNIKVKTLDDDGLRPLSEREKRQLIPKFLRTTARFDFKDLAKTLTPKNQKYSYYKARNANEAHVLFNYRDDQTIAGCPVSARFKNLFGENYKEIMLDTYCGAREAKNGARKSENDILHEAWHVLFSFDDDEKVKQYAREKFDLDEVGQESFSKINTGHGYGALSLKAIRKILPFLEQGLIYSHAVFFANLDQVVSIPLEDLERLKKEIAELVDDHRLHLEKVQFINGLIKEYRDNPREFEERYDLRKPQDLKLPAQLEALTEEICSTVSRLIKAKNDNGEFLKAKRLDERVEEYLQGAFGEQQVTKGVIYHPSKEETYEPAERAEDGKLYLGSPQISAIRNPVFMRTMHRLKALTNELIRQGVINEQTQVHMEMARELNDANKRAAIRTWQRKNETERQKYKSAIEEDLKGQGIERDADDDEILKYQLWEEQNRQCPYCADKISIGQLLSEETEIEHTIPRSLCCDNSLVNKTVSHRECNRKKGNRIPANCPDHTDILQRIEHWAKLDEKLTTDIDKLRGTSGMEKEAKDRRIQQRLVLTYERDYYREKYRRFTMTEITGGFKNSQLVDTRIITKYARLYLKTLFNTVHSVNGAVTDDFRRYWGVEKSRDNHVHHTIDAIVVACISRDQYQALAEAYHRDETRHSHIHIKEPWPHFSTDMEALKKEVLVSHYAPNHLLKQTKKKLRQNGKPVLKNGRSVYQQGKTARGSLHQETFYGAIKRIEENKRTRQREEITRYVVRKTLSDLSDSDLAKIVDIRVREIAQESREQETQIKKAIDKLKKQKATADEARELELNKEIAVMESLLNGLYCLPNKNGAPIPIKKVRVYSPLTDPIELKTQRDVASKKGREHKQKYYVGNDGNYQLGIYEGTDEKGKEGRAYRIINNLSAAGEEVFPAELGQMSLIKIVHGGQLALLTKDSKDKLFHTNKDLLKERLYIVKGIDDDGIKLYFHQEARMTTQVIAFMNDVITEQNRKDGILDKNGEVKKSKLTTPKGGDVIGKQSEFPYVKFKPSNFNALLEGVDFQLSILGEIEWLDREA
jgi:CRISPR-associated endonuclease Csn1